MFVHRIKENKCKWQCAIHCQSMLTNVTVNILFGGYFEKKFAIEFLTGIQMPILRPKCAYFKRIQTASTIANFSVTIMRPSCPPTSVRKPENTTIQPTYPKPPLW